MDYDWRQVYLVSSMYIWIMAGAGLPSEWHVYMDYDWRQVYLVSGMYIWIMTGGRFT